ncbi:hypothetical protein ASPCAL11643 [Aspergillus calidoustus]|uniref:F-box domain-containing protein n=1 Tax=Aspergillus calidoustus TaxID=454130 RepID=A0A0U5GCU0_ASPCI|nr:hypothetical protein ASPCAL11643 [Aspergillus calidoustus]
MSWRIDLSLTRQGVSVTAFSLAVTLQPQPQPTPKSRTFHAFSQLPTELQLHIFRACDAPTLFQLIHTTSHIRTLTLPIFWNIFGRNTWYTINTLSIGYAKLFEITYIAHDKSFAKNIAQVEIDIWRGLFEFRGKYGVLDADKARRFWAMLRDLFPAAQKVVLAGLVDPDSVQLPFYAAEEEEEGQFGPYSNVVVENTDHAIIRGVLQLAPQGIEAFASLPVKEKAASVQLWGIASDSSPEDGAKMWRLVDTSWNPRRLLLPARKDWSPGPVGEYLTMERLMLISSLERNGLAWLRHETHVKFPSSKRGIECPNWGCGAVFDERDRRTPQHVRDVLHARLKRVMGMDVRWRGLMKKLKREAGEEGSEKREIFRNAFLDQMEADGGLLLGDEGERERTDLWVKVCWALDNE